MEKYSGYEFEINKMDAPSNKELRWYYIVHGKKIPVVADDLYDSEQEARYAAIGHITLLENGDK